MRRRAGAAASFFSKSKSFDVPLIHLLFVLIAMMCLINDFNYRNKTHFYTKCYFQNDVPQ